MTSLEPTEGPLTFEELQLATRNRGMPLEALRYDLTPTGLHYLLIHLRHPARRRRHLAASARRARCEQPIELTLDEIRARPPPDDRRSRSSAPATAAPG